MGKKSKNLLGVFSQVKIGLKKILSQKEFFFVKSTFLRKHPQVAKKWVFILKNRNFCYFSQVLFKKLKQNSRN